MKPKEIAGKVGRPALVRECQTCRFYTPPKPVPEKSGFIPTGICRRFPRIEPKSPGEYCGEHRGA